MHNRPCTTGARFLISTYEADEHDVAKHLPPRVVALDEPVQCQGWMANYPFTTLGTYNEAVVFVRVALDRHRRDAPFQRELEELHAHLLGESAHPSLGRPGQAAVVHGGRFCHVSPRVGRRGAAEGLSSALTKLAG